ncbi:hypothetical protein L3C95_10890 [Chitinophaga filiformis]|uniref:hypothetical protein n=1 Tax=Chitinophaga filiformis TaxID=104663 RepID=UPI001F1833CB|nr:hypothetical protein [Chitinophaga filiformis]MCF6402698.1 hypothetical protein [Chitinophaga filiformis]MCF6403384.1 hypothetical protein [Chitinophaga filiformis]
MRTNPEQPTSNETEPASWTTVIWMSVVALIGFGFAVYRFLQFSEAGNQLHNVRLTRIELYIYRATGHWGVIAVFIIMGIFGLYNAIINIRDLRSRKQ